MCLKSTIMQETFTIEENKRYNRHIILSEIGYEGQKKLKNAKVLVIGAGGLGCPVLQYLTAAGVGSIAISDFDSVSESNLQRQILYNTDDIGKPKAEIAAERLKKLNPNVNFTIYNLAISKQNVFQIIENQDVVIDCSDNFPTRYLVSDACVIKSKTLVFGAIYKFDGQVSVFNYKNGPTYRCLFPEQPTESESINCDSIGVLGVLPGIIGTFQANEVLKIILQIGEVLSGKLLQIDALKMQFNTITFSKDQNYSIVEKLGEYNDFCETRNTKIKSFNITPQELDELIKLKSTHYIFDIREKFVYNNYNLGGICINVNDVLDKIEEIDNNIPIVIVCEHGIRSLSLVEYINKNNLHSNILNLVGGIQNWINEGLELRQ